MKRTGTHLPVIWLTYRQGLLSLLLVTGSYSAGFSQVPITPVPEEAKQAITFDLAGSTAYIGASYHYQLIQFSNKHHPYAGAIELSAGFGVVPSICIFGCSPMSVTTNHSLLLLWGQKLQAELGYAGIITRKSLTISNQTYLPGGVAGLRYAPRTWLLRLYIAGIIYQENRTGITPSGDLAWQKTTYLQLIPGVSIGKCF